jgi:pyruvate,orthophosphate dikinase
MSIRLVVARPREGRHEGLARGQGGQPGRDERHRHPGPPGFTITTEVCAAYYEHGKKLPEAVAPQVEAAIRAMEERFGAKLGDPENPLLVSVRSGAALSMPGMMNTILNLGLSDVSVEGLAKKTGNPGSPTTAIAA